MSLYAQFHDIDSVIRACCAGESLIHGMQLHGYAIKSGLESDGSLQNSVLKMYTRTGSVEEVEIFFSKIDRKDDVSWNILISFYSMKGDIEKLVNRFSEMQGIAALSIETLTLLISAFAKSRDLFQGFVQNGYVKDAINLFHQMQAANVEPGAEILRSILDAYTQLGALQLGKAIHGYFIRHIFCRTMEETTYLEASILNMYIRCGNISSARVSFHNILVKDLVIWTTMIEGFGTHGLGSEALELFGLMLKERIKPNSVTFLSLLSACSHSGLVREGCEVYNSMKWIFGIQPNLDHYTCMVDLLGRYGKLKEALAIIVKMVIFSDGRIWGALLAACRVHGDIKLGEYTAQRLLELEPDNVGYHTLLSNVQAGVGRWDEVEEVRRVMNEKDLKKKPGWSCFEAKGMIHGFVSADRSHHQVEEIYDILGCLTIKHYTKDLKVSDLNGNEEVYFPTEREVKMMGDQNHLDPRPVDGALSLALIRLAYDEPSYSCIAHFCDRMDTVFYWVRLLQNRLNVNPSVEEKWVSGMGAIHESLNRKCLPLCSDHINDLYTGKITLQDIDCTSFVDVD
uniref:DYW domain-containing protein n=1 Tax=Fagus sylvatica TaxID=28930 RepID=A0A2N9I5T3_FAGSY